MRCFAAVVVAVTCAARWGGAAGKNTLVIGMPTDVPFVNSLGYHFIVVYSPTQARKVGDDNLHTAPVGSGRYRFVYHKRGQERNFLAVCPLAVSGYASGFDY
jgi:hypothetical protein